MHLRSLTSLDLEEIMNAQMTNFFIKLILRLIRQNDLHRVYEPVNVGLR